MVVIIITTIMVDDADLKNYAGCVLFKNNISRFSDGL
ncbi:unnamed protein product [uncultured virus]|nr:unnamed protein product [uncultured virus]